MVWMSSSVNVTTTGDSTCTPVGTEGSERVLHRAMTCLRCVGGGSVHNARPVTGNHERTTT